MSEQTQVGRALEQEVAAVLRAHGYRVDTNVFLVGRSGGRHEVDVLATKDDALTTYRLAVECKSWQVPVEKDVVAKLHYVVGDLGLHKGVVVSRSGARSGAARTAADLGIDLWGPDELRLHLGDAAAAALGLGGGGAPAQVESVGLSFACDEAFARRTVHSEARRGRRLGRRTQIAWASPLWLPAHLVEVAVAQPVVVRRRSQVRSVTVANAYDSFGGGLIGALARPLQPIVIDPALAPPALRRAAKLHATLRAAADRYTSVATPTARDRHADALDALGIPTPCVSLSIEATTDVHLPYHVAVVARGDEQRVVAVDGATGLVSARVSDLLTQHLSHLRAHLVGGASP